jgi:hypothetical protein
MEEVFRARDTTLNRDVALDFDGGRHVPALAP